MRILRILDDAEPFDPTAQTAAPNLDAAMADRPVGGLGLYLVSCLTDSLCYRLEGGKKRLNLVIATLTDQQEPSRTP